MRVAEALSKQDTIEAEIDDQYEVLDFETEDPEAELEPDKDGSWLFYAIGLDVYNSKDPKLRALVDHVFEEIKSYECISARPQKHKPVLKQLLIILWKGNFLGQPVRYSRDKNKYKSGTRYKELFFTYNSLISVIDALEAKGYIEQKSGRSWYENQKTGFQTRMWATTALTGLFYEYQLIRNVFYSKCREGELIRLSKITKIKVKGRKKPRIIKRYLNYRETKDTKQMRKAVATYNDFLAGHYITLNLDKNSMITYRLLIHIFRNKIVDNQISLNITNYEPEYRTHTYNQLSHILYNNYKSQSVPQNTTTTLSSPSHITQKFSHKHWIDVGLYEKLCEQWVEGFKEFLSACHKVLRRNYSLKEIQRLLNVKFQLKDIGIENLQLSLKNEEIYRDFTRGVQSFKYGGRAYGPIYQGLDKKLRQGIRINDQPTVEKDYSAHHIRMLYNLREIDYRIDPYSACAGEEYRKMFKCALLTLINAANEKSGKSAVQSELEKRGIPLPRKKKPLNWIVAKIKETHKPIKDDICADWGVRLMNYDSYIMNSILVRLMALGILGLTVHDSVIVAAQYEDIAREIMIEEYKKIMGYEPVL